MRDELKLLLLALVYESSQNDRTLYDMVMSGDQKQPCSGLPPCPPSPCPPACPPPVCSPCPPTPTPPPSPCPPTCPPTCPPEPCPPNPCPLPPCKDVCEAGAQIMGSIALGEAALAHIMNAEGEKIQAALANTGNIDKMLEVNASVADMLKQVERLEQTLLAKLKLVQEIIHGNTC